jgi:large conductance mechanosensitive channel
MWKEFKEFAMRGSVLDLAIGLIIGVAFGKIVTSFVQDIITPPLGLLLGHVDFSSLFVSLSGQHFNSLKEAKDAGAPTINYGAFIQAVVDFLIVSFAIFLVIRQVNKFWGKPVATTECPHCLSKIPLKATRCAFCTSELKAA